MDARNGAKTQKLPMLVHVIKSFESKQEVAVSSEIRLFAQQEPNPIASDVGYLSAADRSIKLFSGLRTKLRKQAVNSLMWCVARSSLQRAPQTAAKPYAMILCVRNPLKQPPLGWPYYFRTPSRGQQGVMLPYGYVALFSEESLLPTV